MRGVTLSTLLSPILLDAYKGKQAEQLHREVVSK